MRPRCEHCDWYFFRTIVARKKKGVLRTEWGKVCHVLHKGMFRDDGARCKNFSPDAEHKEEYREL